MLFCQPYIIFINNFFVVVDMKVIVERWEIFVHGIHLCACKTILKLMRIRLADFGI